MVETSRYLFEEGQLDRMRAAEDQLDPGTQAVLERLGLPSAARCLEVGAGGGSIARWLCERVGGAGGVVAIDLDTRFLEDAPRPNLTIRRQDIVRDPLEENGFDLVHARLLLEHLGEREAVLEKLVRALRPGGWLVVEDYDYASAVPISEYGGALHERVQSTRMRMFADAGVDHFFGRKLPALLRGHGLVATGNACRGWIMEGGSPTARSLLLSLRHLRPRLVATGEVTDADMDEMLALLEDANWTAMGALMVAAWGQRPAADR